MASRISITSELDFIAVNAAGGLNPRSRNAIISDFGEPDEILSVEGIGPFYIWTRHVFVDRSTNIEYRKLSIPMNKSGTAAGTTGTAFLE